MPTGTLYRIWKEQLSALRPRQRATHIQNFAWLMVGIFCSRSVHLSKIAGKVLGEAKLLSTVRRLERFLDNPAIDVRAWYAPIAKQWIGRQWQDLHELRLVVDGTKIGCGHQLLLVGLAYRRRTLPLAWTWVKYVRGHSSASKQLVLLKYVRTLLPADAVVVLVGDSEFGSVAVLKQLAQWHWFYALRQKSNTRFRATHRAAWQPLKSWVKKAGDCAWLPKGWLTHQTACPTSVLVYWKAGEKEPWCLATNLPQPTQVIQHYKRRMWIEEMFGDLKKHGFDLESTHLRSAAHLSRLTLVVAFLFDWLIATGGTTIHAGLRHWVDRKTRRDLSLFQIGWRFVERQMLRSRSFPLALCAYW